MTALSANWSNLTLISAKSPNDYCFYLLVLPIESDDLLSDCVFLTGMTDFESISMLMLFDETDELLLKDPDPKP